MTTLDPMLAMMLAAHGIEITTTQRHALVEYAQRVAHEIATRSGGDATSDDVAVEMEARGFRYADLGNAAGAIFRHGWEWTGAVTRSQRPSSHGRLIRIWRRRDA